jgi:hypothetical protein
MGAFFLRANGMFSVAERAGCSAKLEAKPHGSVAVVFFADAVYVATRNILRPQLLWREMSPYIDIDAVMIWDPKKTLCIAHHCTYSLACGVD